MKLLPVVSFLFLQAQSDINVEESEGDFNFFNYFDTNLDSQITQ